MINIATQKPRYLTETMVTTSEYDCVSSSEPSTSSLDSNSNGSVEFRCHDDGATDFSKHRDDASDLSYRHHSLGRRRRYIKQIPKKKHTMTKITKIKLSRNYGKVISKEIPIGVQQPVIKKQERSRVLTSTRKTLDFIHCAPSGSKDSEKEDSEEGYRRSPDTPANVESCRYSISEFDYPVRFNDDVFSNTLLNSRVPCLTPPFTDECYSPNDQVLNDSDFDDDETEFMNATNKIYENLSSVFLKVEPQDQKTVEMPQTLPPRIQVEDEASLYGRLTALLLTEAKNDKTKSKKITEVQEEVKIMFGIPSIFDLKLDDDLAFSRNCAILGQLVATNLRQLHSQSPQEFSLQVKRLHKLLYSLKKKNAFLSGVGRFVQRLFRTV
ncbi:unnamed protein product [Bursaphelenchus okinawaensis]|uniref:Uncharacterized protein n=1 Tax=Bursaphelenchus okinawaensis TaxID=465554 RepID=A0A811KT18_9BILA|nr:unnamed protein product [Bursaphelenchus okinawaensis]CAG9112808.1 unnamed protein product [Bursaphelenchus okinawaensis]